MTITKRVTEGRNPYYQWTVSYKPYKAISLGRVTIINKDNCKVVEAMIRLSLNGATISYFDMNLVKEASRIRDIIVSKGWEDYV